MELLLLAAYAVVVGPLILVMIVISVARPISLLLGLLSPLLGEGDNPFIEDFHG